MKHSFTKSLMCTLLLLIGTCTNVWADAGYFDSNASDVLLSINGGDYTRTCDKSADTYAIPGTVSTLTLKGYYVRTWKNNGGDVTSSQMEYRIYRQGGGVPGMQVLGGGWKENLNQGGTDQKWGADGQNIDLISKFNITESGTYVMDYCFNGGGCGSLNNNGRNYSITFTFAAPAVSYFLKHPWGGDSSWSWLELDDTDRDGIWTVDAQYGSAGCNWKKGETGDENWIASPTLVGTPTTGDECTFAFNSSNNSLTITKKATTYAVTLTKNQDGWGTIDPTSIPNVASGTSISADGATLTVGSTNVVATAAEQTAQYTYGLANPVWTWDPSGATITAATTATANFTRTARTYNITYKDQGGGDYSGSNGSSLTANYTFDTGVAVLVAGVKAGYTFGGWFDNSACTGAAVTSIANDATGDKTLYAKWEATAWKLYCSEGNTLVGTFSLSAGIYTLENVTMTASKTYYYKYGDTQYHTGADNITTGFISLTSGGGQQQWSQNSGADGNYNFTIKNEGGTWKVKAVAAAPIIPTEWKISNGGKTTGLFTEQSTGVYKSDAIILGMGDYTNFYIVGGTTGYTTGSSTSVTLTAGTEYAYATMKSGVYMTIASGTYYVTINTTTGKFIIESTSPAATWTLKKQSDNSVIGTFSGSPLTLTTEIDKDLQFYVSDGSNHYAGNGSGSYNIGNGNNKDMANGSGYFVANNGGCTTFTLTKTDTSTPNLALAAGSCGGPGPSPAGNERGYFVYLGTSYQLPAGYTWTSTNAGATINAKGVVTGNKIGKYVVNKTDGSGNITADTVYVYRYYVKQQWGYNKDDGTASQSEKNAAWVWSAMQLDGSRFLFTGQVGNDNLTGGNLCWDYTYDWNGVYQTDNDGTHNFHPGLDNDSKMGYWGNGAHKYEAGMPTAPTGATTWKEFSLSQSEIYDFTYTPGASYNGDTKPDLTGGEFNATVSTKTTYTVSWTHMKQTQNGNISQSKDGGDIVTTSGSTSGVKVLEGTKVTFHAEATSGYIFKGWYSDEDCLSLLSEEVEYTATINAAYQIYALFAEEVNLYIVGIAEMAGTFQLEYQGNNIYTYTTTGTIPQGTNNYFSITNAESAPTQTWGYLRMNLCEGSIITGSDAANNAQIGLSVNTKVIFNVVYNGDDQNIDICVTAVEGGDIQNPDWFLVGEPFGGWDNGNHAHPFNKKYREIDGYVMREVTWTVTDGNRHFRLLNGSTQYYGNGATSGAGNTDLNLDSKTGLKANDASHSFWLNYAASSADPGDKLWFVLKTTDPKQFWIQKPETFYNVNVVNKTVADEGTYVLSTLGGVVTKQFANKENYKLVITANNGYVPSITVDGQYAPMTNEGNVFTYLGQIKGADQNIVITYAAPQAITLYLQINATNPNWRDGANPYVQYKVDGGEWVKHWDDEHNRAERMEGFSYWYVYTFPVATSTIEFQVSHGKWATGDHQWSQSKVVGVYEESYCYSVDDYKVYSPANEMRLSKVACPEMTAELTVGGATGQKMLLGTTAKLSTKVNVVDENGYATVYTYYVSKDGADYVKLASANYLVRDAGVYKFKVLAEYKKGAEVKYSAVDESEEITVGSVMLEMTPSAETITPNTTITLTPHVTGLASGAETMICMSATKDGQPVEDSKVSFSESNGIISATFSSTAETGSYLLTSTLKLGDDCGTAYTVTSATNTIEVGSTKVTLAASPATQVAGGSVTLTTTTDNLPAEGTVHYAYTVQSASETMPKSVGSDAKSFSYTLPSEDTYIFTVVVTKGSNSYKATATVTASAKTIYINYPWNNGGWDSSKSEQMTYCGDGVYTYYNATKSIFMGTVGHSDGNGADIYTGSVAESNKHYIANAKLIDLTDADGNTGIPAIFMYNINRDELMIMKATTTLYRIKSKTDYGTFYSNDIEANGAVSFFATPTGTLTWQKFSSENTGAWVDVAGEISASIGKNGIYTADAVPGGVLSNVAEYTGTYYIYSKLTGLDENTIDTYTPNISNGVGQAASKMTKFSNISSSEFYNHYWVEWIASGRDAYATVGNKINRNLAKVLPSMGLKQGTNVRYAYNPETNYFSRSLLAGSTDKKGGITYFLKIYGQNVKNAAGSAAINTISNAQVFNDGSDWVYTTNIKATKPASIVLAADYDDSYTYLLSSTGDPTEMLEILGGLTEGLAEGTYLDFYVSYDYKTNRVIAAWKPSGEISSDLTIDADMIVIRDADSKAKPEMFTISNGADVKVIRRIIVALELDRDKIVSNTNAYKNGLRSQLFQISLPFNMKLTDVYGMPNYAKDWVIQIYNGERRARKGWTSYQTDFWYDLAWNSSTTLEAGRGYVLQHNLKYGDFVEFKEGVKTYAKRYVYFTSPRKPEGYVLDGVNYGLTTYAPQPCTVSGREKEDSDWRFVGVPGLFPAKMSDPSPAMHYVSIMDAEENTKYVETPNWLYEWKGVYGSYVVKYAPDYALNPTSGYMLQYNGIVGWKEGTYEYNETPAEHPASVALRAPVEFNTVTTGRYCLALDNTNQEMEDQTYVVLKSDASEDYVIGDDLLKSFTSAAPQVYSIAAERELAANTLCDTTTMVPLGVALPNSKNYSIRLEDMTSSSQVPYLYDATWNTYTNLSSNSYPFVGKSGRQEGRFFIVFGYQEPTTPSDSVTTGMSENGVAPKVEKVLFNGVLYILREGKLYDATGRAVR